MSNDEQIRAGFIASRFARLSTSGKLLLILTLALLPLGLIASLASIETARANHANRAAAARLLAGDSADRLSLFLDHVSASLRLAGRGGGAGACRRAAEEISVAGVESARVALFNPAGRLICASASFPGTLPLRAPGVAPQLLLDGKGGMLRVILGTGQNWALAELPRALLAKVSHPNAVDGSYDLRLADGRGGVMPLAAMRTVALGRDIVSQLPVAQGQLRLAMRVESLPLSANELLITALPLLMWLAAAAIGWVVANRLILRPLGELQRAIETARARGGALVMPAMTTPAQEIRDLGDALSGAMATIARHEAELEDGLARQTRLTREVHHRVKNNLQVVASLLNIHARGARTPEAIAAYGAIQRRVDALALVHRSHYAELEINRGVALRPLIGELAANLRGSAPPGMAPPRLVLDTRLFSATQDVAVPVAFLITELVELAMFRLPGTEIRIGLDGEGPDLEPGRARLSIVSPGLADAAAPRDEAFVRGERVVGGLARQLRTTLVTDAEAGRFALDIIVMDEGQPRMDGAGGRDLVMQQRGGALPPVHMGG
ncbi:sensor histidine kinase [Sphingomonas morindae]|uniref:histidine kinase n=1 Tax=Sphingomonas morindae TaxID=1541170 RepID=A0ABY4X8N9_9SPHN|nr:histidine kinase dimerization/phosphoacceptor domain -containing protein [Sphingomonas morindae]USI73297.1 histidine kinase [Sphingomonas morindae]